MLFQDFIKKVKPFAEIDSASITQLMEHIEEINLPAETILFRQNDPAECCYLLYSGKVEVTQMTADNIEKAIAELESGSIIGELALLTENKRNATIKTLTPCTFFVLKHNEFQQLARQSKASAALTSLLMDRHRPLKLNDITIHTRKDATGQPVVILKNAAQGTYFKTSEEGLFVFQLLDGEHTIQDIAMAFFYTFHKIATDDIGHLIFNLMQSGFVETPMLAKYVEKPQLSKATRALLALRNVMQYEYSFPNVDAWVTRNYQKWGYLFFTCTAKIIMALMAMTGFFAFVLFFNPAQEILKATPYAWILIILMGPVNLFSVPLHELAHAFATKAYGREVHRFGLGWFWIGPIAFADTSDMWLATRGPRTAVNLVGIYVNIIISGILSLLAWLIPYPVIAVFLWLIAFSSYLMAFYNLNPSFELDGYYVLMDLLDKPNLRTHAIKWLVSDDLKKTFFSRKLAKQYASEILYWIISIAFIFFAAFIAYLVQTYIFNSLLPVKYSSIYSRYLRLFLPIVVLILSFVSLYSKVKQQSLLFHKN